MRDKDFDIPVKIEKGSLIIDMALGFAVTTSPFWANYLYTAAKKMAENDFQNIGLKNIFSSGIKGVRYMISVAKHQKTLRFQKGIKWRENDVLISNDKNETLSVPTEYMKPILGAPKNLISDMASVVNEKRTLIIGTGGFDDVTISNSEREIFCFNEEENIIFPELKHGMSVNLPGVVTRANGLTNSMGFFYNDHVLTCVPNHQGRVTQYKALFFTRANIVGVISRYNPKTKNYDEPKPKIIFDDLLPMASDQGELLF